LTEITTSVSTVIYYNLRLIENDEDDNKFVDCAFSANAEFIITNDHHFNILKTIDFPSIPILSIDIFKELMTSKNLI